LEKKNLKISIFRVVNEKIKAILCQKSSGIYETNDSKEIRTGYEKGSIKNFRNENLFEL
jgi:hypothetical protein